MEERCSGAQQSRRRVRTVDRMKLSHPTNATNYQRARSGDITRSRLLAVSRYHRASRYRKA